MRRHDLFEEYRNPFNLPIEVIEAFHELGSMQRGKPEQIMVSIQHTMGGGVLNPVVEHAGDLIHRITHQVGYGHVGYSETVEKVERIYKYLSSGYGFEREMRENIRNNSQDPEQLKEKLDRMLYQYAKAHEALPAYNDLHLKCKKATVAIGHQNWNKAQSVIFDIKMLTWEGKEKFAEAALEYELDETGQPKVIG